MCGVTQARFTRVLRPTPQPQPGPDIEGIGRALARAGFLEGLAKFIDKTPLFRRTYNVSKQKGVNRARAKIKLPQTGVYDEKVHEYLERLDAFDRYAQKLMLDYRAPLTYCYPVASERAFICQGLHETGGLPGNWAIDFCAPPGSGIVAPLKGTVYRFSGHPPQDDTADAKGVFGWTTYLAAPGGYECFITHQGARLPTLRVGMTVQPGDLIGFVGDQHYRPDHAHVGISSPKGPRDAKQVILAISRAPRPS